MQHYFEFEQCLYIYLGRARCTEIKGEAAEGPGGPGRTDVRSTQRQRQEKMA